MIDRRRAREKLARLREKRWENYEEAAAAISDGDAGLAEVCVDVAERSLKKDLEVTGGHLRAGREPHPVDVSIPPLAALEGDFLVAMASDLMETVERDPTVEPAGPADPNGESRDGAASGFGFRGKGGGDGR